MTLRLLPEFAALFVVIFARLGTLAMLLPGLGEQVIPARIRLAIAFVMTLMFMPVVRPVVSINLGAIDQLIGIVLIELAIGLVIGTATRLTLSAMQTAGTLVSQQIGLSYSAILDPITGQQDTSMSAFLMMLALAMIFALDLHHLSIRAIADSYTLFRPGVLPAPGDAAQLALMTAAGAFTVGIKMATPFLIFGIVFNLGLGVLSRLMPQLQIFFMALPATIMVGTLILVATIALMMGVFITYLRAVLLQFIAS